MEKILPTLSILSEIVYGLAEALFLAFKLIPETTVSPRSKAPTEVRQASCKLTSAVVCTTAPAVASLWCGRLPQAKNMNLHS